VLFNLILNFFSCCLVAEKVEEKKVRGNMVYSLCFFIVSELYYKVFALVFASSPFEWKVRNSGRLNCFVDSREIL
jgi:hypothetical protein